MRFRFIICGLFIMSLSILARPVLAEQVYLDCGSPFESKFKVKANESNSKITITDSFGSISVEGFISAVEINFVIETGGSRDEVFESSYSIDRMNLTYKEKFTSENMKGTYRGSCVEGHGI